MVKIEYNTTQVWAISLDEFATSSSYYLFEIYSEMQNRIVKTFVAVDIATTDNRLRANRFRVTEVGSGAEDLYGGRISMPNNGTYLLNVYVNSSSGNLSTTGLTKVCCDVLKVYGNPGGEYLEYNGNDQTFLEYKFDE